MLLRFGVTNHLSIRTAQELSLVATKLKGPTDALIASEMPHLPALLPVAVLYGGNAAGKSNMLLAMDFMRQAVLKSHTKGNPTGGVPRFPFALDSVSESHPSEFDSDFFIEGVRYNYGFTADNEAFLSEWLYSYPEGKRRRIFERTSPTDVTFGATLQGQRQVIKELMRPNSLYVSTAAQNNHEELTKVSSFFQSMKFRNVIQSSGFQVNHEFKKNEIDERAVKFLKMIGTGIIDYRKRSVKKGDIEVKMEKLLNEALSKDSDLREIKIDLPDERFEIEFAHAGVSGSKIYFDIDRESSGTRRLIHLLSDIFYALDNGTILIIDEIDASLHTLVCDQMIALFSDKSLNRRGAQLICTTHDTNLLNSKCLRRDQIWLVEKDDMGASEIYSLAEVKTRESDNFELGYLQGRYGAVPFSGNISHHFSVD